MAKLESLYEHIFLKAADLDGRDFSLTIDKVQQEVAKTQRGAERAVVIYFRELKRKTISLPDALTGNMEAVVQEPKKLWCNKTNGRTIAGLHGDDIDNWPGKMVTIYPTTTSGKGGKVVDCIRVRNSVPQPKNKPPQTDNGAGEQENLGYDG